MKGHLIGPSFPALYMYIYICTVACFSCNGCGAVQRKNVSIWVDLCLVFLEDLTASHPAFCRDAQVCVLASILPAGEWCVVGCFFYYFLKCWLLHLVIADCNLPPSVLYRRAMLVTLVSCSLSDVCVSWWSVAVVIVKSRGFRQSVMNFLCVLLWYCTMVLYLLLFKLSWQSLMEFCGVVKIDVGPTE
jgi:hypothetical protein